MKCAGQDKDSGNGKAGDEKSKINEKVTDLKNKAKAVDIKDKTEQLTITAGQNAKKLLSQYSGLVQRSSGIKQLGIGVVSGWCTGFLTTRVGRTAAFAAGGTIILIALAGQTGLVRIDWDRMRGKLTKTSQQIEHKIPKIQANVGRYARSNTYFVAGFLGGFCLGLVS